MNNRDRSKGRMMTFLNMSNFIAKNVNFLILSIFAKNRKTQKNPSSISKSRQSDVSVTPIFITGPRIFLKRFFFSSNFLPPTCILKQKFPIDVHFRVLIKFTRFARILSYNPISIKAQTNKPAHLYTGCFTKKQPFLSFHKNNSRFTVSKNNNHFTILSNILAINFPKRKKRLLILRNEKTTYSFSVA